MKHTYLILLLIFFSITQSLAQVRVTGTVKDADTELPLPGVNILITGTSEGTVTDIDGNYSIQVSPENRLQYSYVGFVDQEITVGSQTVIDIFLTPDARELDEVVVTSLGLTREKMALNYSVTEVSGDNFIEARENNIANALSGRIAGVNVSNLATGPAGASRIVIRGNASLTQNNQPLYVMDGMPIDNSTFGQAGMWGGADWGDGTISINPDDIESISVLKGANASALYGSRASNGVILITTKKGKKQKGIGIEFNSNFVWETLIDHTDLQTKYGHGNMGEKPDSELTGYAYASYAWGDSLDGSMSYTFDGVERPYVNTFEDGGNNMKKFYRDGYTWTNSFSATGGSENQTARFSFSHLNNESIVPNSGFKRMNLGLNYNGKYGNFELAAKLYYSKEDSKNRPRVSDAPGNANITIYYPASVDVRTLKGDPDKLGAVYEGQSNPDPDKNIGDELSPFDWPWWPNPYWATYQFVNDSRRDRVIGQVQGRYNFTNYLYAHIRVGIDWQSAKRTSIIPYGTGYLTEGKMTDYDQQIQELNYEWMVGFRKMWNQFGINTFIGGNAMEHFREAFSIRSQDFNIPFFHSHSNGSNQSQGYWYQSKGINSLFGSLELSLGGYLYLTATARNDWFSTLDPSRNSILYPSAGLSFVFSDLINMPAWWNIGKIRASWAQVGGDTNPYNLDQTYSLIGEGHLGQALAEISQNTEPNRELDPLTSTETEVGLNLGFFNNRLGLDVAFYIQNTTNDIVPAQLPRSSGYEATWINVGEIENKGYEILLTGSPIRGNFSWDIELNFSENRSKVVKISEELDKYRPPMWESAHRSLLAFIEHREGEPYGAIVGYEQLKVDGNPVIDENGYPVRYDTLKILGYGVHPYTGGVNNTFSFKGWNLSFLIDFKFGADIFSGTDRLLTAAGMHKQTLEGRADSLLSSGVDMDGQELNVWIPGENLQFYWWHFVWPHWGFPGISEPFIYDASFVKLRQVTFGYTFPDRWLRKTPFSHLSLSFVGRNLAVLYKKTDNIDPESTYNNTNCQGLELSGVPPARSYGFNLNVRF